MVTKEKIPDAYVEKLIITELIVDEKFCEKVIPILKSNLDDYIKVPFAGEVSKWCVDYYSRYKKPIGRHIQDEYYVKEKQRLSEDDAELISAFVDGLSKEFEKRTENINADYAIDRTLNYFRSIDIDNLQKQLQKGNNDKSEKLIADFKTLDFETNVENTKRSLKDFKTVYLVSEEKHIKRMEWIVGDAEKVVMIPGTLPKDYKECFSDKEVVLVTTGKENKNVEKLKEVLPDTATGMRVIDIPFLDKEGVMFHQHMKSGDEFVQQMYQDAINGDSYKNPNLVRTRLDKALDSMIMPFEDFYMLDLPSREMLLYPWIQESDIILITSDYGVGKTWLSMELSSAIGNGRDAMSGLWKAVKQVKSLYCDGEQHYDDVKRVGRFVNLKGVHMLSKSYLEYRNVYPALNLNEQKVRALLYDYIIKHGFKFVVLDNLFSLWAGIDLDSAKEWHEPNQWLLKLRSKGVCVVLDHHLNKAKQQMGSQSKLFNINTSLVLMPTKVNNEEDDGIVSFSIKVDKMRAKGRGLGNHNFTCDDGVWTVTEKKEGDKAISTKKLIVALLLDRKIKSQTEIAFMLKKCNQSYISRIKKEYEYLFNTDGTCNSEGNSFLSEHNDLLNDFYRGHDIQ